MSDGPLLQPVLKEEVFNFEEKLTCNPDKQNMTVPPESSTGAADQKTELEPQTITSAAKFDDVGYCTINAKNPYFDVFLSKSHVACPFTLYFPTKIVSKIPSGDVSVVLMSKGKSWDASCCEDTRGGKRLKWKTFAQDNDLKIGDCCFFEIVECNSTSMKLKVIILSCPNPSLYVETEGDTPEKAILIE